MNMHVRLVFKDRCIIGVCSQCTAARLLHTLRSIVAYRGGWGACHHERGAKRGQRGGMPRVLVPLGKHLH